MINPESIVISEIFYMVKETPRCAMERAVYLKSESTKRVSRRPARHHLRIESKANYPVTDGALRIELRQTANGAALD